MIRVRCPICDREMEGQGKQDWPAFPFCSPKCRLIDLGRWLGEQYGVPVNPEEETSPEQDDADESP
jgi:endogenous inhibitor of DNA gyrase (YacG/DUF329 family)